MDKLGSPNGNGNLDGLLRCPTPTSQASSLITHRITKDTCLKRQRELYHKCFTCVNSAFLQATRPFVRPAEPARAPGP